MSARLILFSDFLKSTDKSQVMNTLEYMGKREGVVLNEDKLVNDLSKVRVLNEKTKEYTATSAQKGLIDKMLSDFPDLKNIPEYDLYMNETNMHSASSFIVEGIKMLEEMAMSNEVYMKYISERPGVEKNTSMNHGLFDQKGAAEIDKYAEELDNHNGNVYRDIISLRLVDAEDLGYTEQDTWKSLLQSKMMDKAKMLGIPTQDFKWIAAFHNEGYHPHVHVMHWDAKGSRGFQDKKTIVDFKSALANEVFKNELWLHKELKTEYRKELENQFSYNVNELDRKVLKSTDSEAIEELKIKLNELSHLLRNNGSKYFAYQSEDAKNLTNKIVANLLESKPLNQLTDQYVHSQASIASFYLKEDKELPTYISNFQKSLIDPKKGDRKVFQNIVVKAAYEIKQKNFEKTISLDHKLNILNARINLPKLMYPDFRNDSRKVKEVAIAIAKMNQLQEKSIDTTINELKLYTGDEETALELLLKVKEDPLIQQREIKLLAKAFNVKLQSADYYSQTCNSIQSMQMHSAAKVFQQFCNFLSCNTISNEQEIARIKSVRREDEFMIRKSKINDH